MSALRASPILPQGLDDLPPPPPSLPPYLKVWICHCWKSCVSALQARPGQTATMVFIFICLPQYPLTCWQSKTVAEHWHGFQSSKVHWCWNLDLDTTQKRTRCLRRLLQTSQDKGAVGKKYTSATRSHFYSFGLPSTPKHLGFSETLLKVETFGKQKCIVGCPQSLGVGNRNQCENPLLTHNFQYHFFCNNACIIGIPVLAICRMFVTWA